MSVSDAHVSVLDLYPTRMGYGRASKIINILVFSYVCIQMVLDNMNKLCKVKIFFLKIYELSMRILLTFISMRNIIIF